MGCIRLRNISLFTVTIQTRASDDHSTDMLSSPTVVYGLIRAWPISQLEIVAARVSSRALMFQWNPSGGYYDGYDLTWIPEDDCPTNNTGSTFLTREKAISNEIEGRYHFYKLENLHPDCLYYFSVKVKLLENGLLARFNATDRETKPVKVQGKYRL